MKIFRRRKGVRTDDEILSEDTAMDSSLFEGVGDLGMYETRKVMDQARTAAEATLSDAAKADLRDLTVMRKGRCPECGSRTESLVFSSVCPSCGWFRRYRPDFMACVVHQNDGEPIQCDSVYNVAGGYVLCVKKDVIVCQLAGSAVRRIDFTIAEEKLREARQRFAKENAGHCSWCDSFMAEATEEGAPILEYVAFGTFQERYLFCQRSCLASFRNQYSVRVHRNCYETDCNTCHACTKRYDTEGFHRVVLADFDD